MIFKNCESLYCTPVTYRILYINYTSIKKKKEKRITVCKAYKYTCKKILNQSAFILKGGETESVSS